MACSIKRIKRLWWAPPALLILVGAAFLLWVSAAETPMPEALAARQPDARVHVETAPWLVFRQVDKDRSLRLRASYFCDWTSEQATRITWRSEVKAMKNDRDRDTAPKASSGSRSVVSVGLGLALGALTGIVVGLVAGVAAAMILGIL